VSTAVRYRGRFAPSPTGPLHFGSLLAAFASWLDARHHQGEWLLRIEDIDRPREVAGATGLQLRTLQAFGLESDRQPVRQSERTSLYAHALATLDAAGEVFECSCSRSDLAATGGIHRSCLRATECPAAIRLRVPAMRVGFVDRCRGEYTQALDEAVGDFVLRRSDGLWSYQLAVVVDDAEQGITDVVRGADLLDSTPRQILLQRSLGLPTPRYLHVPLVLDSDGRKLSKSAAALPVDAEAPLPALRAAWAALGQDIEALSSAVSIDRLLRIAVDAWQPRRIGRDALPLQQLQQAQQSIVGRV
jgi:glutamyl-Q tRNA(Asp) synthetase